LLGDRRSSVRGLDQYRASESSRRGWHHRLATIHRELAANDPHAGIDAGNQGKLTDQTVEVERKMAFSAQVSYIRPRVRRF
jgi:hypothetical protein